MIGRRPLLCSANAQISVVKPGQVIPDSIRSGQNGSATVVPGAPQNTSSKEVFGTSEEVLAAFSGDMCSPVQGPIHPDEHLRSTLPDHDPTRAPGLPCDHPTAHHHGIDTAL